MKRKLLLYFIILKGFSFPLFAQGVNAWGDPHVVQQFKTEASKNPEYSKLRNQIQELIRTATPNNTNAAAVKALLTQQTALLKTLYTRAGIRAPGEGSTRRSFTKQNLSGTTRLMIDRKFKPLDIFNKTVIPPYKGKTLMMKNNCCEKDTGLSNFSQGKIVIRYTNNNWNDPDGYGLNINLFKHEFTVPNNPAIVAAEISFEYSYQYTGWDTYGAVRGLNTMLRVNGPPDPSENNLPQFNFEGGAYFPPYRIAGTIWPMDTVTTEFDDFVTSGTDSLTLLRYLTPGQQYSLEYGIYFPYHTSAGANGSYHYAEMILKKIRVRYLKAQN